FSSRRRHTRSDRDWSSDVCSSDLLFERSRNGYVRSVSVMERHAVIVMLTFGALLIAVWGLIATRPTGLVPPEDQGYLIAVVSLRSEERRVGKEGGSLGCGVREKES